MLRSEERRATPEDVARLGERLVVHAVEAWVQRHSEGRITPRPSTLDDIMDTVRWPVEPVMEIGVVYARDPEHPRRDSLEVEVGLRTGRVLITRVGGYASPEYGPFRRMTRLPTLAERAVERGDIVPSLDEGMTLLFEAMDIDWPGSFDRVRNLPGRAP
jgi:hypothetical protein